MLTSIHLLMWTDLETSGLSAALGDQILEVSVSLADINDPFDTYLLTTVQLHFPEELHHTLDPYVREMHTRSGLLAECAKSKLTTETLERELLASIPVVDDRERRPTLAGSTVHFDRSFLERYMPTLTKRLSHRHYDVSSLKLQCQSLGMPKLPKAEAHRAEADVQESIEHGRQCFAWLRNLNASS